MSSIVSTTEQTYQHGWSSKEICVRADDVRKPVPTQDRAGWYTAWELSDGVWRMKAVLWNLSQVWWDIASATVTTKCRAILTTLDTVLDWVHSATCLGSHRKRKRRQQTRSFLDQSCGFGLIPYFLFWFLTVSYLYIMYFDHTHPPPNWVILVVTHRLNITL